MSFTSFPCFGFSCSTLFCVIFCRYNLWLVFYFLFFVILSCLLCCRHFFSFLFFSLTLASFSHLFLHSRLRSFLFFMSAGSLSLPIYCSCCLGLFRCSFVFFFLSCLLLTASPSSSLNCLPNAIPFSYTLHCWIWVVSFVQYSLLVSRVGLIR